MGLFDTLIDGKRSVQTKMFKNMLNTYEVGDKLPCDGSFIIMFPDYEEAPFAIVKDGTFLGLTDCPPLIVDKWGKHLSSYDDFEDIYQNFVDNINKELDLEDEIKFHDSQSSAPSARNEKNV